MKIILLFLLTALTLQAQTVRVPIELSFEMPIQTNGSTIINITTNINVTVLDQRITTNTFTTNITFITQSFTNSPTAIVVLTNNIINARLGTRLARSITGPSSFTFANFTKDTFTSFYWINPSRFPLSFQTQGVVWMGSIPTNQARGVILAEQVGAEIWLTP